MSAIVCGKRSFFEDIESGCALQTSSSPPPYKKFRCSTPTSPVRFNYSHLPYTNPVDQLKALYPDMEVQLLEKALEESGNDIENAIRLLNGLHLGYSKCPSDLVADENTNIGKGAKLTLEEPQVANDLPVADTEWVDLFVGQMTNATSIDDARFRAMKILENFEKSISTRFRSEDTQICNKENMMLKEQMEILIRDNLILKRAVAIQHERQKESEEKNQEVQQLKHLVVQYQEQLRAQEMNNYALQLHLRQAQNSRAIPTHFNPDVF